MESEPGDPTLYSTSKRTTSVNTRRISLHNRKIITLASQSTRKGTSAKVTLSVPNNNSKIFTNGTGKSSYESLCRPLSVCIPRLSETIIQKALRKSSTKRLNKRRKNSWRHGVISKRTGQGKLAHRILQNNAQGELHKDSSGDGTHQNVSSMIPKENTVICTPAKSILIRKKQESPTTVTPTKQKQHTQPTKSISKILDKSHNAIINSTPTKQTRLTQFMIPIVRNIEKGTRTSSNAIPTNQQLELVQSNTRKSTRKEYSFGKRNENHHSSSLNASPAKQTKETVLEQPTSSVSKSSRKEQVFIKDVEKDHDTVTPATPNKQTKETVLQQSSGSNSSRKERGLVQEGEKVQDTVKTVTPIKQTKQTAHIQSTSSISKISKKEHSSVKNMNPVKEQAIIGSPPSICKEVEKQTNIVKNVPPTKEVTVMEPVNKPVKQEYNVIVNVTPLKHIPSLQSSTNDLMYEAEEEIIDVETIPTEDLPVVNAPQGISNDRENEETISTTTDKPLLSISQPQTPMVKIPICNLDLSWSGMNGSTDVEKVQAIATRTSNKDSSKCPGGMLEGTEGNRSNNFSDDSNGWKFRRKRNISASDNTKSLKRIKKCTRHVMWADEEAAKEKASAEGIRQKEVTKNNGLAHDSVKIDEGLTTIKKLRIPLLKLEDMLEDPLVKKWHLQKTERLSEVEQRESVDAHSPQHTKLIIRKSGTSTYTSHIVTDNEAPVSHQQDDMPERIVDAASTAAIPQTQPNTECLPIPAPTTTLVESVSQRSECKYQNEENTKHLATAEHAERLDNTNHSKHVEHSELSESRLNTDNEKITAISEEISRADEDVVVKYDLNKNPRVLLHRLEDIGISLATNSQISSMEVERLTKAYTNSLINSTFSLNKLTDQSLIDDNTNGSDVSSVVSGTSDSDSSTPKHDGTAPWSYEAKFLLSSMLKPRTHPGRRKPKRIIQVVTYLPKSLRTTKKNTIGNAMIYETLKETVANTVNAKRSKLPTIISSEILRGSDIVSTNIALAESFKPSSPAKESTTSQDVPKISTDKSASERKDMLNVWKTAFLSVDDKKIGPGFDKDAESRVWKHHTISSPSSSVADPSPSIGSESAKGSTSPRKLSTSTPIKRTICETESSLSTDRPSSIKKHSFNRSGVYTCRECSQWYIDYEKLKKHMKVCAKTKPKSKPLLVLQQRAGPRFTKILHESPEEKSADVESTEGSNDALVNVEFEESSVPEVSSLPDVSAEMTAESIPESVRDESTCNEESIVAFDTNTESPVTSTPAKETPTNDIPAKETPTKDIPAKETPTKDIPAKETPTTDIPAKETPTKDIPAKETPTKDIPAKETPTKDIPAKESPKKSIKPLKKRKIRPCIDNLTCNVCQWTADSKKELFEHVYQHSEEELQARYNKSLTEVQSADKNQSNSKSPCKNDNSDATRGEATSSEKTCDPDNQPSTSFRKLKPKPTKEQISDIGVSPVKVSDTTPTEASTSGRTVAKITDGLEEKLKLVSKASPMISLSKLIVICECHKNEGLSLNHVSNTDALQIEINLFCRICRVLFRRIQCFETHYRKANSALCRQDRLFGRVPRLFCNSCRVVLASVIEMRCHLEMHFRRNRNGTVSFVCNICKVIFIGIGEDFYHHWTCHEKDAMYMATAFSFKKLSLVPPEPFIGTLLNQDKVQENYILVAEHVCRDCKAIFELLAELIEHEPECRRKSLMVAQNKMKSTAIQDKSLDEPSTSQQSLTSPQKIVAKPRNIRLICGLCNMNFTKEDAFQKHEDEHRTTLSKPDYYRIPTKTKDAFLCKTCVKIFDDYSPLERHWVSHSKICKEFVCCICDKHFKSKALFQEHTTDNTCIGQRADTQEYWSFRVEYFDTVFVCKHCDQYFTNEQGLTDHITTVHTNASSSVSNREQSNECEIRKSLPSSSSTAKLPTVRKSSDAAVTSAEKRISLPAYAQSLLHVSSFPRPVADSACSSENASTTSKNVTKDTLTTSKKSTDSEHIPSLPKSSQVTAQSATRAEKDDNDDESDSEGKLVIELPDTDDEDNETVKTVEQKTDKLLSLKTVKESPGKNRPNANPTGNNNDKSPELIILDEAVSPENTQPDKGIAEVKEKVRDNVGRGAQVNDGKEKLTSTAGSVPCNDSSKATGTAPPMKGFLRVKTPAELGQRTDKYVCRSCAERFNTQEELTIHQWEIHSFDAIDELLRDLTEDPQGPIENIIQSANTDANVSTSVGTNISDTKPCYVRLKPQPMQDTTDQEAQRQKMQIAAGPLPYVGTHQQQPLQQQQPSQHQQQPQHQSRQTIMRPFDGRQLSSQSQQNLKPQQQQQQFPQQRPGGVQDGTVQQSQIVQRPHIQVHSAENLYKVPQKYTPPQQHFVTYVQPMLAVNTTPSSSPTTYTTGSIVMSTPGNTRQMQTNKTVLHSNISPMESNLPQLQTNINSQPQNTGHPQMNKLALQPNMNSAKSNILPIQASINPTQASVTQLQSDINPAQSTMTQLQTNVNRVPSNVAQLQPNNTVLIQPNVIQVKTVPPPPVYTQQHTQQGQYFFTTRQVEPQMQHSGNMVMPPHYGNQGGSTVYWGPMLPNYNSTTYVNSGVCDVPGQLENKQKVDHVTQSSAQASGYQVNISGTGLGNVQGAERSNQTAMAPAITFDHLTIRQQYPLLGTGGTTIHVNNLTSDPVKCITIQPTIQPQQQQQHQQQHQQQQQQHQRSQ